MTREEVMNELKDICLAIDEDGELVAEDSLDALAIRLMEEGSDDISEVELDAINGMIYDSFAEPATICNELINMLMSSNIKVEDIEDPLMADIWDDVDEDAYYDDLTDEEVAALTSDDGVNYAEYPDHEYQEGCEGKECKEELIKTTSTVTKYSKDEAMNIIQADEALLAEYEELLPEYEDGMLDHSHEGINFFNLMEDESKVVIQWCISDDECTQVIVDSFEEAIVVIRDIEAADYQLTGEEIVKEAIEAEEVKEGYYGRDSILDGDIPGKENSFYDLISMRFHNMGYDDRNHPLYLSEENRDSHSWCPYKQNAIMMFGPDEAFFDKIIAYIETEVNRPDSAWYNRQYSVVKVGDRYNRAMGEYALCIFVTYDDFCSTTEMSRKGAEKAAELRRMRKGTKPAA